MLHLKWRFVWCNDMEKKKTFSKNYQSISCQFISTSRIWHFQCQIGIVNLEWIKNDKMTRYFRWNCCQLHSYMWYVSSHSDKADSLISSINIEKNHLEDCPWYGSGCIYLSKNEKFRFWIKFLNFQLHLGFIL